MSYETCEQENIKDQREREYLKAGGSQKPTCICVMQTHLEGQVELSKVLEIKEGRGISGEETGASRGTEVG